MGAKIMIQTDTICLIEDRLHLRSGPHRRARDDRIVNSIFPSSLFMCDPSKCSVYAQTLLLFGKVVCNFYSDVSNPRSATALHD